MAGTLRTLIVGNPEVDFVYTHKAGANTFNLDTREIKNELEDVPITHPEVLKYISENIKDSLAEMRKDDGGSPVW